MSNKTKETLIQLWKDESGDILQNAIIMAILAVVAVGGLMFVAPKIKSLFDKTGGQLDSAGGFSY